MKQNILTLLFLTSLIISSCSKNENSLNDYNLQGKVRKINVNTFETKIEFGKYEIGEKNYSGNYSSQFNEFGNIVEYIDYDRDDNIKERQVINYDQNNIISNSTNYDSEGNLKLKFKQYKDSKDRVIKSVAYNPTGNIENTYIFEFLDSGKKVNGKCLNNKGKVSYSWSNELEDDYLKTQIGYDSIRKVETKTIYERNDKNDFSTSKVYDSKNALIDKTKYSYKYDSKNNWIEQKIFDKNNKLTYIVKRKIFYYDDDVEELNSDNIIGIWNNNKRDNWTEFKKDGTYDIGYNENINDYGKWELNNEQKTLTLKSEKNNSKKYLYSFEEQKLILSDIDGKDKTIYEKR